MLIVLATFGLLLSSCKTNQDCPAYGRAEQTQQSARG